MQRMNVSLLWQLTLGKLEFLFHFHHSICRRPRELTCYLMAIRLVQTDLGDRAAQYYGLEKAPVTLQASVRGIIAQVVIESA